MCCSLTSDWGKRTGLSHLLITHATGHRSRLARDLTHAFGSDGYAREELIAELDSAFLCAALGIVLTVRHADYLASWLDVLRGDARAIFRAASAASKAADRLLASTARAMPMHCRSPTRPDPLKWSFRDGPDTLRTSARRCAPTAPARRCPAVTPRRSSNCSIPWAPRQGSHRACG